MQILQQTLCWTPAPPNLLIFAQGLAKVMMAVWFLSSIGANAPQVTLTMSFGGEGVVSDRRGSNILSIYGSMPHTPVGTVSLSDVSTSFDIQSSTLETPFCMLLILFQTAQHITFSQVNATCLSPLPFFLFLDVQLIARCAKHYIPFQRNMQPVSPCAKHCLVTFYATCVSPVQFFLPS